MLKMVLVAFAQGRAQGELVCSREMCNENWWTFADHFEDCVAFVLRQFWKIPLCVTLRPLAMCLPIIVYTRCPAAVFVSLSSLTWLIWYRSDHEWWQVLGWNRSRRWGRIMRAGLVVALIETIHSFQSRVKCVVSVYTYFLIYRKYLSTVRNWYRDRMVVICEDTQYGDVHMLYIVWSDFSKPIETHCSPTRFSNVPHAIT